MKKVSELDFSGIQSGFRVASEMAHGCQVWRTDDDTITITHRWKRCPRSSAIYIEADGKHYETSGEVWDVERTPILSALWKGEKWENVEDEFVKTELNRAISAGELAQKH